MISVAPIAPPLLIGEKRVVLRNITWQGYQQLLQILGDKRAATLIFDRGTLEITMPLEEHEFSARLIELLIRIFAVELGLKIKTMGSTTLDRSDLERGAEPDNAYYIQNQPLVAGRTVDYGREWRIYKLENDEYLEVSVSPTFSILPKSKLYEFLAAAQLDEVEAEVNLRNWVRENTDR
ncbi:MAG: Uma2 family endonuclease [Oscillatoriales cyanobacterium]|nr:MAG: Uma2 family endonuclease [Oscillatoriales cyanobacterium]